MKVGLTMLVLSIVAVACTGSDDKEVLPIAIHARQPDHLFPDWDRDAIFAAWDAACPKGDRDAGSQSWSMEYAHPSPNAAGSVVPNEMGGTVTCADGSRHEVVIFFDRS
jgi:hypothetical protein